MIAQLLIGVGIGLTSFLLYASATQFTALALFLFYLAPLPILLATLGWGRAVGIVSGLTAWIGVSAAVAPIAGLVFLATVGAPSVFLAYLAGLSHPLSTPAPLPAALGPAGASPGPGPGPGNDNTRLAWYPLGRLMLWAVAWGIVASALALVLFTSGSDGLTGRIRALLDSFFAVQPPPAQGNSAFEPPDPATLDSIAELMARMLFPAMTAIWVLTMLGNLWMSGRILLRSRRLRRPWPVVRDIHLPMPAGIAFIIALGASMAPGMIGQIAVIAAAGLGMALILLGLAVVHTVTAAISTRSLILVGLYGAVVIFAWPALALAALGLAEIFFALRARMPARQPPGPGST